MPSPVLIDTTLTTPGSAPFSLWVGPYDIVTAVPLDSIRMEDNGSSEIGQMEWDVVDMALAWSLTDGALIRFVENQVAGFGVDAGGVALKGMPRWTGFLTSRRTSINATGRVVHCTAQDASVLLDKILVPADYRTNETSWVGGSVITNSDRYNVIYLMEMYGAALVAVDQGKITTTLASQVSISKPMRLAGLTLRQAIEQCLANATSSSTYYMDAGGRLHTLGATPDGGAAPYQLRVGTPGGGEIAPEDLRIEYDTQNLINAYYVKGAVAAGSGWVIDPVSVLAYGRREDYLDAPDSDLATKRDAIGQAYLADSSSPIVRGSFVATSPYDGWAAGQSLTINSAPQFGIAGATVYRIVSVRTTFLDGTGSRQYEVAFGGTPASFLRSL